MDALAICELQILAYSLELIGIPRVEHPPGMDCSKIPTSYFVTSPNMKQIPNISKDTKDTYIRQNGRFWTHDLALFPQWFFPGTKHLPFITRRPSIKVLPTHLSNLSGTILRPQTMCLSLAQWQTYSESIPLSRMNSTSCGRSWTRRLRLLLLPNPTSHLPIFVI